MDGVATGRAGGRPALSARANFRERLEEARRLHVDARVIAFHLLATDGYLNLTRLLFAALRSGEVRGQTSAVTLYQLLSEVYRAGETPVADRLLRTLTVVPGLEVVPLTPPLAAQAAHVRARLGGRSERAMQIATALAGDVDVFLTQGSGLRRIAGMTVIDLDDYAAEAGPGVASRERASP